MDCLSPLRITSEDNNPRTVSCGRCVLCLHRKRVEWTYRILCELDVAKRADFITFTYDEDNIVLVNNEYTARANGEILPTAKVKDLPKTDTPSLYKRDMQNFVKRLRQKNVNKIRYYVVGEYGTHTARPHYHGIFFNIDKKNLDKIRETWGHGGIKIGTVTHGSVHYTTKYMINKHKEYKGREPPFSVMSRKYGIGLSYIDKMKDWHRKNKNIFVYHKGGYKHIMPRYLREKIWTKEELKVLMLDFRLEMLEQSIVERTDLRKEINRKKVTVNRIIKSSKSVRI